MIELMHVTTENFDQVLDLRVTERQSHFVATNVESLAQAYVQPGCFPYAVYHDGEIVGFTMYCRDPDDNEWWLYRLMITEGQQGKGYGRAALKLVLDEIRSKAPGFRVFLGVEPENTEAKALYESMGFRPDGRMMGGEEIMALDLKE